MTRFFSSWYRTVASLFSGTAIAVTCLIAVNAGAMIVMSANSEIRPASATPAVTALVVDWDRDLFIYSDPSTENVAAFRLCIARAR